MSRVLFRVDVGSAIGLGHLARSLALAAAGRDAGMQCVFLAVGSVIGYRTALKLVTDSGFEVKIFEQVALGGREDLERTLDQAARHSSDAVVVDSYHVDGQFFERLRAAGLFVIANDDLALHPFPCQLVVNGGAHACELPYRSSSGDTRFLLGPEYALLRPEFRDLPRRAVCAVARNILVTLGGADPRNLMPRLLGLLAELPGDFEVAAIIGPFFKSLGVIERIASRWREGCVSASRQPRCAT
jgi:UDP-2,4-diacetamido-2,4,6-trideoxy-beta-L-altropyranose hydrolase